MKVNLIKRPTANHLIKRQATQVLTSFKLLTNYYEDMKVIKPRTRYPDMETMYSALLDGAKRYALSKILDSRGTIKKKVIDVNEMVSLIIDYSDLIVDFVTVGTKPVSVIYTYNYSNKIYESLDRHLNVIITLIGKHIELKGHNFKQAVYDNLTEINKYSINLLPKNSYNLINKNPNYIIRFRNKIVNRKTGEVVDINEKRYKKYHFLNSIDFDFKTEEDSDKLSLELSNRVFDYWSNNDEETKKYLLQIVMAVLECNGRNICHIFDSPGGNGKSSFGDLLEIIAGHNHSIRANIDQYANNNYLNQIDLGTNLIFGDDLPSNKRITGNMLGVIKTLISGGAQQAEVKYANNTIVQTNAVFIQCTNSKPEFLENTDALIDRFVYHYWNASVNFRRETSLDYNLAELLGKGASKKVNKPFIEAVITLAFKYNPEYFDKFSIPTKSKNLIKEVLNESDQIYQFVEELKELQILEFEYLPVPLLYSYYTNHWVANQGAIPAIKSSREFKDKLVSIFNNEGFKLTKYSDYKRMGYLEKNKLFNPTLFKLLTNLNDDDLAINPRKNLLCLYNSNNKITDEAVASLEARVNSDDFDLKMDVKSIKDVLILTQFINDYKYLDKLAELPQRLEEVLFDD